MNTTKPSPETRRLISEALQGNKNHRGYPHTAEARKKMSESSKGQVPWNKGKTGVYTEEALKRFSEAKVGKTNTNGFKSGNTPWNKGLGTISTANELARKTKQYRDWRKAVFERDNYTCQDCGERGGELNADHIKQFAYHPELRYDITNGQTLCVDCHRNTKTWGFRATNGVFNLASS